MIAQRVLIALPATAATLLVGGCATNQSQGAGLSGQSSRCVREFGPAGKVPPIVMKCTKPSGH